MAAETPLDASRLGSLGQAFLAVVREHWPGFLPHTRVRDVGGDAELVLEVPSPRGPEGPVLWICADVHLDEVIVAFGGGHSHGGAWRSAADPDHRFAATIELIAGILDDEVVGCGLDGGGGALARRDRLEQQPFWPRVRSLRSWSGAHDLERDPGGGPGDAALDA